MATPIPQNTAPFTLGDVARVTGGQLHGDPMLRCIGVTTDTRAKLDGQLFVALQGASFDGHTFLARAIAQGAVGVVSKQALPAGVAGVVVQDTLVALGALAREHRQRWGGTVVAVAGSAGKTTTKSAISALFRALLGEAVQLAPGNLNNRIGVPMVLLGLQPSHQVAVIEVGTNQTGEVAILTAISRPDIAVLTLIDLEHTEGLGGLEQIAIEEGAIYGAGLRLAVGNADDVLVKEQLARCSAAIKRGYGFDPSAGYRITRAELTERCSTRLSIQRPDGSAIALESPWLGEPGALATTAALCVAEHYAQRMLEPEFVQRALNEPGGRETGRLQPLQLADGTLVIDDTYNANPASVRAAISIAREVADMRGGRLHLVLGEMRELGAWSRAEHARLAQEITQCRPASVSAIAGEARCWAQTGAVPPQFQAFYADSRAAALVVPTWIEAGDVVLVKASRGVRAELVVEALVAARGLKP